MTHEIIKLDTPELGAIEKSKANQIKNTFLPMAEMLSEFEDRYIKLMAISEDEITIELTKEYKRLRLDIGRVRIDTGHAKDKAKEYLKLEDKAIMGIHNVLVWAVKEKEDNLKERENFFEIKEKKRRDELQSKRLAEIFNFVENAELLNLADMPEDVWAVYLSTKKKAYEDIIEAEKKAEADRIKKEQDEAAERERIRKENEALIAAAIETERLAKIESDKREAERKAAEDNAKAEREAYELKLKAERDLREKNEREEAAKREKLEAELKSRQDAERKAAEEAEKNKQVELSKGDAAKIQDLINDFELLKVKYSFKSEENKKKYLQVGELLNKVILHINK